VLLRIFAVLTLVAVVSGGTWYFLRSTPAKEAKALREKVEKLVRSQREAEWLEVLSEADRQELRAGGKDIRLLSVRLDLARRAADRLLEISTRESELLLRAMIEQIGGEYEAALKFYNRFSAFQRVPAEVYINKARIYQRLGRYANAEGELLAVVDERPYEANYEIGRMEQELFLLDRALGHFQRALDAAQDPRDDPKARERIDAQDRIAETYSLKIALGRALAEGLAAGPQQAAGDRDAVQVKLEKNLKTWRDARDAAVDDAVSLLRNQNPGTSEFAANKVRLGTLYERYEDDGRLRTAIQDLAAAIERDRDHRFTEIHRKLGSMRLRLARQVDAGEAANLYRQSEQAFKDSLDVENSLAIPESSRADPKKLAADKDVLRSEILLAVAEDYLATAEGWRILQAESNGVQDALDLAVQIERIAREGSTPATLRARMLRAVAFLKHGREKEGEEELVRISASTSGADRINRSSQLADLCLRSAPDSVLFLRFLGEDAPLLAGSAGIETRARVGLPVRLMTQAIAHRKTRLAKDDSDAVGAGSDGELRKKLEAEVREIDKARQELLEKALSIATDPDQFLVLAQTAASVNGREAGIRMLKEAITKLQGKPELSPTRLTSLRVHLALWSFEKAIRLEIDAKREPGNAAKVNGSWWEGYRESLAQYLMLFKDSPYHSEFLKRTLVIISRFQGPGGAEQLRLADLVQPLFSSAPATDVEKLTEFFRLVTRGKFAEIARRQEEFRSAKSLRPYITLLLASALLYESDRLKATAVRGDAPPPGSASAASLLEDARRLLDDESALHPEYLPLAIEKARVELTGLSPGQNVEDRFLVSLRDLVKKAEGDRLLAFQVHTLQAEALKRRFDSLLETRLTKKEGQKSATPRQLASRLSERRTALRRAILANPEAPEAYLRLAETYFGGREIAAGPSRELDQTLRELLEPDYVKAANVLSASPETPQVLSLLGMISQTHLRSPKQALRYYSTLMDREPSEAALRGLMSAYAALATPEANADVRDVQKGALKEAEDYLKKFRVERLPHVRNLRADWLEDYDGIEASLLAGLAQERSRTATDIEKAKLKEVSIGHYRQALSFFRAKKKEPPLEVVNNLAWLLCEVPATAPEAMELVEELRGRLVRAPDAGAQDLVDDTYAWVLFQNNGGPKALEVYKVLTVRSANPSYRYRYAKVLAPNPGSADREELLSAREQLNFALAADRKFPEQDEARKLKGEVDAAYQRLMEEGTKRQ